MKKLASLFTTLIIMLNVHAQADALVVKTGPEGLYLEHEVQPKEGLFAIGRIYNVHPRHLASFNDWDYNKGLSIGQVLKIPLSDTNFNQSVNKGVPVYYTSSTGENLTSISRKINNVDAGKLSGWNKLSGGEIKAGTRLLAGFLITDELSDRVVEIKPVLQTETEVAVSKKEEVKEQIPPPVTKPVEKKTETANNPPTEIQETEVKKPEIKSAPPSAVTPRMNPGKEFGFFRDNFYRQIKSEPMKKDMTVTSSIFKTISGWADEKYYLLLNDVEPGTIVKITNPANGKMVYAKTLYGMDKIRQNQGVDIRISDAAASILSIYETDKFIVKLSY